MDSRSSSLRRAAFLLSAALISSLFVLIAPTPANASPTDYIEMSDGINIAVNIRMPDDFVEGKSYPTVFEMNGYDGGSADGEDPTGGEGSRGLTKMFYKDYVTIHASVRGTGCSGGEFDLFSWRSALDGREIVEWINEQPWSNGKIGLYGHSYGGITGFMVGATRPPSLDAMSVSGLIDDLYRGIVYPGGVSNYGFPLLWTGGVRTVYDVGGGTWDGLDNGDPRCAEQLPTRESHRTQRPDHSRSLRHRQHLVPGSLAHQLRGADQGADSHLRRVPGRADGTARSVPPVRRGGECSLQAFANGQRRSRDSAVRRDGAGSQGMARPLPARTGQASRTARRCARCSRSSTRSPARCLNSRTFPLEQTNWTDYFLHSEGGLSRRRAEGRRGVRRLRLGQRPAVVELPGWPEDRVARNDRGRARRVDLRHGGLH